MSLYAYSPSFYSRRLAVIQSAARLALHEMWKLERADDADLPQLQTDTGGHMTTLAEELERQIKRVRDEVLPIYDTIPEGQVAATIMRHQLDLATKAAINGDVVAMIRSCKALEGFEL